ncbi:MAG: glyoxalase [Hyphomicrobiales bacterium]|nr:MAG: glyoxalase [Hyphomicrobiales bacterium]
MAKIRPNLMVSDIRKSIAFYCGKLGFSVQIRVPLENEILMEDDPARTLRFAMLALGDMELFLQSRASLAADVPAFAPDMALGASMTLYMDCDDVDALYERIRKSAEIVKPPHTSWYGMRELYIKDPDGYVLAFGKAAGPDAE